MNRPTPEMEHVQKLVSQKRYREAGQILDVMVEKQPDDALIWRKRAYLLHLLRRIDAALEEIEIAIRLEPHQPDFHFTYGTWLIDASRFEDAIAALNTCLELEHSSNHTYYVEACYFFRAIACIYLGLYDECLEDCARVREGDYHFWSLNRLYTKAELIDCATRRCVPPLKQRASAKNSAQEQ